MKQVKIKITLMINLLFLGMFYNLCAQTAGAPYFVPVTVAAIASLNCDGATHNGTLRANTTASGVSSLIRYTGGNGSAHTGQTVASTGVTGLTATRAAGNFAVGNGSLSYTITGIPNSIGIALFAINIGGRTCTLSRWVGAVDGTGTFAGKLCYDIAESNNDINNCGPLSSRSGNRANFNTTAFNTQNYNYTPTTTVSNVRFYYVNNGSVSVITNITGNNPSNNINTTQTATVTYNSALSSPDPNSPSTGLALGVTNSNPLTADIYIVYNDGPLNNGTDRQIKLTPTIKDCVCCMVKVSSTQWKEFLCHNLGADTSLDPHDMTQSGAVGLQGAYIQWGRRGPNYSGNSVVDWTYAPNDGPEGFRAAPTAADSNAGIISDWATTPGALGSWTASFDPCPAGYRVPTSSEWQGVLDSNTMTFTGSSWIPGSQNYNNGIHFGTSNGAKLLTLPTAGNTSSSGSLMDRGRFGSYWSSNLGIGSAPIRLSISGSGSGVSAGVNIVSPANIGSSLRCIAK